MVSDGRRVSTCLPLCRSVCAVEVDDDERVDSRTADRPCSSGVASLPTGGLPERGLTCLMRDAGLLGSETPGEYEDMELGVEERLKRLGESEYPVEGVVEGAYCGNAGAIISVGPSS